MTSLKVNMDGQRIGPVKEVNVEVMKVQRLDIIKVITGEVTCDNHNITSKEVH